MDSDGKTLRNSSNSSVGHIDSDGKTIRNSSNSSVGHVDLIVFFILCFF